MAKKRNTSSRRATREQTNPGGVPPVVLIGGAILAAVLLVVGLFYLSQSGTAGASNELDIAGSPTFGDEDAPVTIIEFSDYGCPHCRDFNLDTYDQLHEDYVETGQVKFVVAPFYLNNPVIGRATQATLCANDQGKFLEYRHALFEAQGQIQYSVEELAQLVPDSGLDPEALTECINSGAYQDTVDQARLAAQQQGVNSTPTFFVNNQRIEGNVPYSQMQRVIEQELAIAQ